MDRRGGWHFRMTCEKRCCKRLEGGKPIKHLARLFVRTKTQVNECFSVVFHKDAILEISPVQGSELLHHPANMLLVLCRVCRLHDIPIGGNDHTGILFFLFSWKKLFYLPHREIIHTYVHFDK